MKARTLAVRLGLAAGTLVACGLLIEAVYRFRVYGWDGFSIEKMNTVHVMSHDMLRASPYDEIRYLLRPGIVTRYKMAEVRTNAHGMRDDECTVEKPPNTLRIAFVGDSFVQGMGVEHEHVFHTRLERMLASARPGRRVECLNFGVGGFSLRDYEGMLRHCVPAFEPDLVVVGLCWNDGQAPIGGTDARWVPPPTTAAFFHLHAWNEAQRLWDARDGPEELDEEDAAALREKRIEASKRASEVMADVDYVRLHFEGFRRWRDEHRVPLLLVYLSFRDDPFPVNRGKLFARVALETELPYLDMAPFFEGRDVAELIVFENDYHPNAVANDVFARELLRRLEKRDLIELD